MLYTIGISIILAGCYIVNPVIICAGLFVVMASNNTPVKRGLDCGY